MANVWPILQTSVSASLSYLLAAFALGSEEPFFAPIAAVATLGLAPGGVAGARSRWQWESPSGSG
jgi:hypothetical protein